MIADAPASPVRAAVVGAGSIDVAFAIVFARAGWQVRVYDPDETRRRLARQELKSRVDGLAEFGLVTEPAGDLVARVAIEPSLANAVRDAQLVQECAPESLDLKRELFAQLDAAPADAVLASSSSALTASSFAAALAGRERCLVAHPGNPPYLLRIIELVPAPFTRADVVDRAEALYRAAGLIPVRVAREVEGFVFNRLQGALLREAYCLVRDGVATVADIDKVMREGDRLHVPRGLFPRDQRSDDSSCLQVLPWWRRGQDQGIQTVSALFLAADLTTRKRCSRAVEGRRLEVRRSPSRGHGARQEESRT